MILILRHKTSNGKPVFHRDLNYWVLICSINIGLVFQKRSFPPRISVTNANKETVSCIFVHLLEKSLKENFFLCIENLTNTNQFWHVKHYF